MHFACLPALVRVFLWTYEERAKSQADRRDRRADRFCQEFKLLDFTGGTLGDQTLSAEDIRGIAKLPSRHTLNAQLAGVVASPLTGLVRGLGSMISGLAIALGQVAEQKAKDAPPEPA